MAKFTFKTNLGGHYEVRSMPRLVGVLEAEGKRVMDAANQTLAEGEGYEMSSKQGNKGPRPRGARGGGGSSKSKGYQGRWAVRVYTASNHAKRSNAVHNTLVNLLGN